VSNEYYTLDEFINLEFLDLDENDFNIEVIKENKILHKSDINKILNIEYDGFNDKR